MITLLDYGAGNVRSVINAVEKLGERVKVAVTLKLSEEFSLHWVVLWALSFLSDGLPAYQMGIETESIAAKDMLAVGYAQKSEMVRKVIQVSERALPPKENPGG